MSAELLKKWTSEADTPLSSRLEDIYPSSHVGTPSITDQYVSRVKESEAIFKGLKQHSSQVSKKEAECVAICDEVLRDSQLFLKDFLKRAPLPEIDWEEDTGYMNLSWRISSVRILTVLVRGDSHIIFSGVFESGQETDGTLEISRAANIVLSVFEGYSVIDGGREFVKENRGH